MRTLTVTVGSLLSLLTYQALVQSVQGQCGAAVLLYYLYVCSDERR